MPKFRGTHGWERRRQEQKANDVLTRRKRRETAMVARCTCLGSYWHDLQLRQKRYHDGLQCYNDKEKVVRIGKYLSGESHKLRQMFLFGRSDGMIHAS